MSGGANTPSLMRHDMCVALYPIPLMFSPSFGVPASDYRLRAALSGRSAPLVCVQESSQPLEDGRSDQLHCAARLTTVGNHVFGDRSTCFSRCFPSFPRFLGQSGSCQCPTCAGGKVHLVPLASPSFDCSCVCVCVCTETPPYQFASSSAFFSSPSSPANDRHHHALVLAIAAASSVDWILFSRTHLNSIVSTVPRRGTEIC